MPNRLPGYGHPVIRVVRHISNPSTIIEGLLTFKQKSSGDDYTINLVLYFHTAVRVNLQRFSIEMAKAPQYDGRTVMPHLCVLCPTALWRCIRWLDRIG